MKKLLVIFTSLSLLGISSNVVACSTFFWSIPNDFIPEINLSTVATEINNIDGSSLVLNDSIDIEALTLIREKLTKNIDIDYQKPPKWEVGLTQINVKIWQTDLPTNILENIKITINNIQPRPKRVDLELVAKETAKFAFDGSSYYAGQKSYEISKLITKIISEVDLRVKFEFKDRDQILKVGDNPLNLILIDRNYLDNQKEITIIVKNVQAVPIKVDLNEVIKNKNLGEIYIGTSLGKPDADKITNILKANNPHLIIDKISITNISANSAQVISRDDKFYFGKVSIKFETSNVKLLTAKVSPERDFINAFDGNIYTIANGKKVYKLLADGSDFEIAFQNQNFQVSDLVIMNNGDILLATNQGLYHSLDKGNNFNLLGANSKLNIKKLYVSNDNQIIYFEDENEGKLFYYDQKNDDFLVVPNTGHGRDSFGFISEVIVDDDGFIYFANASATKKGLWKGNTNSIPQKIAGLEGLTINKLKIDQNGEIFVATDQGLYCSLDKGNNFSKINGIENYIFSIFVNANNDIYLGGDKFVWKRKNGENNFKQMTLVASHGRIEKISVDHEENIYYRTAYGSIHKNNNVELKLNINVIDLTLDKDGNVYFSTYTEIYKSDKF